MPRDIENQPRMPVVIAATAVGVTVLTSLPAYLLGGLAVQMSADLGYTEVGLGMAVTTYYLGSAIFSAPGGRLVQRLGPRRSIRIVAVVVALTCVAIAFLAQDFRALVLVTGVTSAANGMGQPAANLLLVRSVPSRRQGLYFGVKQAAVPTASLLAGAAVPTLALTVGWRWAYVAAMGLALVVLVSTRWAKDVVHVGEREQPTNGALLDAVGIRLLVVAVALAGGAANTIGVFLSTFAVSRGFSEGAAGVLLFCSSLGGAATRITVGWWADRLGGGYFRIVVSMLTLGGAAAIGLAFAHAPALIVTLAVATMVFGWGWNGLFAYAVVMRSREAASVTGIIQTGVFAGTVLAPVTFGLAIRGGSYTPAWLALGCALALGGLLVHRADPDRGSDRAPCGVDISTQSVP